MEVRYELLMPREIEAAMQRNPLLYQPLGTIEWHGLHNVVGLDSLKAHALCVEAARRSGGLVAPPIYGGIGGLDEPHTFVYDAEDETHSMYLRPWLEKTCMEAARNGFKAVILLTGHYGAAQQIVVRETAVRMTRRLGIPVYGTPEYFLAHDLAYYGDHAAWGETSLMMHLAPDLVDLSRLGDPPHQGVGGRDPKAEATAGDGQRLAAAIIDRLARLGARMAAWDKAKIAEFAKAECVVVAYQQGLAMETGTMWGAWRNIAQGVFAEYGELVAEGRFEEIPALAARL